MHYRLARLLIVASVSCIGCGGDDEKATVTDAGTDAGTDSVTDSVTDAAAHGPLGFSPSNVPEAKLDFSGVGDVVWNDNLCGNTLSLTDSMTTLCEGLGTTYKSFEHVDGKNHYTVFVARNFRIEAGQTVALSGTRPIILVALDSIEIIGQLNADPGIAGGALQGNGVDANGPGEGGGKYGGMPGPRGGGGGFCGKGGDAGAAIAKGGIAYGTATLIPLRGGSSGGGPYPGGGGAAVQLVAGRRIHIGAAGRVYVPGGGGHSALNLGGGGGAGGAILLESKDIAIEGALAANGGGGGSNNGGGEGQLGTATTTPAKGDVAGPEGAGGAGSGGATVAGGNATGTADVAGNGGGGAGWIRLNTSSGAATVSGIVTPAAGSTCLSQGKIAL